MGKLRQGLKEEGKHAAREANPPILKWLGWITAAVMAAAAVAMFATI